MKTVKEQIPLPLEQPIQPPQKKQPDKSPRTRDTNGKPQRAGELAKTIMQKLMDKNTRKAAAAMFLIYQLVETTVSLFTTF